MGSRTLVHWDPPCNITNGIDADFMFGLVYTADLSQETASDGRGG